MSNKRIKKKRTKAAQHQRRVEMIANLAVWLCPRGPEYKQHQMALALWKRNDAYLSDVYRRELVCRAPLMRVPFQSGIMNWSEIVNRRAVISDVRERKP